MKRLPAICSLIPKCNVLADIGCDHGFLSKFVLDNCLAAKVVATDISAKCLKKAQQLLHEYDNIEFICTDGLTDISADVVVIAGMGGTTIIDILNKRLVQKKQAADSCSKFKKKGVEMDAKFVLQPQSHARELRFFLTKHGYKIVSDFVAKENGKYYDIMLAIRGEQNLSDFQLSFGVFYDSVDNTESSLLLKERLEKEYKKYNSFNDGGKNSIKRSFLKEALIKIGSDKIGSENGRLIE